MARKERKRDEEYRTLRQEFAFVERAGSAVCLTCNDNISSTKRSNTKRHFDTRHTTFASKYPAGEQEESTSFSDVLHFKSVEMT